MNIFTYETNSNVFSKYSEEKNGSKLFELLTKNDKLINIKIYHPNGEILNETSLVDGKMISYKIYNEKTTIDKDDSINGIPNLDYEIKLDGNKILSHYKFYDPDTNKLTYEGGYVRNKKSGYGSEYYKNGKLIYQGYYHENKRTGYGNEFSKKDKLLYSGNWFNNEMHDQGELYYDNANIKYCGMFIKGYRNGFGTSYDKNGNKNFQGNWYNDKVTGNGKVYYSDGNLFLEGYFDNEYFKGVCYNENNIKTYDGEMTFQPENKKQIMTNGLFTKNGHGTSFFETGTKEYSGEWKENKFTGNGTLHYKDGSVKFNGEFNNGKFHGFGAKYDLCEDLMVVGQWYEGKLESVNLTDEHQLKGYEAIGENNIFVGEIHNGKKSGYGEEYQRKNGLKLFEGYYKKDEYDGLGKQYYHGNLPDHQALQYLGTKFNNFWHGYSYNYHSNGKFMYRVFCRDNKQIGNKFTIEYKKNGAIDFEKSHNGDLYLVKEFNNDYM